MGPNEVDRKWTGTGGARRAKWIVNGSEVVRFGIVSVHSWNRNASVHAPDHFSPLPRTTVRTCQEGRVWDGAWHR
jgi:hypothetical protein